MTWDKIEQLLNIVEKSNPASWPKLRPIHEAAMAELDGRAGNSKLELLSKQVDDLSKARDAEAAAHSETKKLLEAEQAAHSETKKALLDMRTPAVPYVGASEAEHV